MDGERLAVERLPVGIRLRIGDGEEAQGLQLAEDPDRRASLLDHRVRRAEGDVGLSAQYGLGGEVLFGELDQLDLDAPLAHPLERDEEVERLDALDVAECDPDAALDGSVGAGASATASRTFLSGGGAGGQNERDHEDPSSEPHGPLLHGRCTLGGAIFSVSPDCTPPAAYRPQHLPRAQPASLCSAVRNCQRLYR